MEMIERICEQCAKPFSRPWHVVAHGRGKYCSLPCKYAKRAPMIALKCAVCRREFTLELKDYNHGVRIGVTPTHCSTQCAHASPVFRARISASLRSSDRLKAAIERGAAANRERSNTPEAKARCRENYARQMADPEKRARWLAGVKRRSESAEWRAAAHFQRGPMHPRYKGQNRVRNGDCTRYEYKAWRKAVFRLDGYTCQHCGIRGGRLNAHHVLAWATHPELRYEVSNGLTLCQPCHLRIPKPTRIAS